MRKQRFVVLIGAAGALFAGSAFADNIEGPWGAVNGDLYQRARSADIPVYWEEGSGIQQAWRLDLDSLSAPFFSVFRNAGRHSIVFDAAGNLYFNTFSISGTAQGNLMTSVRPDGTVRWQAHNSDGSVFNYGNPNTWFSTSPVVGDGAYVYGISGNAGPTTNQAMVAAIRKDTGEVAWTRTLNNEVVTAYGNQDLKTPVLYNGKLYVLSIGNGTEMPIYQIDSTTGAIDWSSRLGVTHANNSGAPTLVPNAFGAGQHGLYFNATGNDPAADGPPEVYGVNVNTNTNSASIAWSAQGGHVARTHVIYNPDIASDAHPLGLLYTHTWTDYGAEFYSFDPLTGFVAANNNGPNSGHGFYDSAALDWDNASVIAGGFDGNLIRYTDDGTGTTTDDFFRFTQWFGEYRIYGQALRDCAGNTVYVSGTNSRTDLDAGFTARALVIKMSDLVSGGTELDGPVYIDDISVVEDPNGTPNVLFSEDFESLTAGMDLPPQGGWELDNVGASGVLAPTVEADSTGGGQGNVAVVQADANDVSGWKGMWHDFTDSTADEVRISWKQYSTFTTENVFPYFGGSVNDFSEGWHFAWDQQADAIAAYRDSNFLGAGSRADITAGVWQTVTITYSGLTDPDPSNRLVTIDVDGGTPGFALQSDSNPADPTDAIRGWGYQLTGTPPVTNPFVNPPLAEFTTGINANHGYTTRGGPLVGPDGKMYYFHANDNDLVALEPITPAAPCATCIEGDSNGDGLVNFDDIDCFVAALISQAAWEGCGTTHGASNYACANDIDDNGSVNFDDIDPFIVCLITGTCP